jgi:HEAT repeat protein
MKMIEDPEFADRSEELRRTVFQTLADVGDASIVPALEAHLTHGGWLARPSLLRTAVAHTLAHLGVPEADAALKRGRSHRSEAVRTACREMTDRNTT